MIEFNLLPDIKQQYIKAKRIKRLIFSVSVIVSGAALAIFLILLIYVDVFQKDKINNLSTQISNSKVQLESNSNLNKVLTIQNQLKILPSIYAQLPQTDRLFGDLAQIVPNNATISSLTIDFQTNTIVMSGTANTTTTVNQLIDTISYALYTLPNSTTTYPAFNSVDVNSITPPTGGSSTSGPTSTATAYEVTFKFDPKLFNVADNTQLVVKNETTTQSILDQPIFKSSGGQ